MQLANAPSKVTLPFANSGAKNTIPVPSQTSENPGGASYTDGFPPATMLPVNAGGIPPSGQDFNGILNELSALLLWFNSGASFVFDPTFAAAVGGYPSGARLLKASGAGYWRSTADNNTNNPDTGGSGWVSIDSGSAVSSVYAGEQQSLAVGNSKVIFDTVEFDTGLWDATNKRFLANATGPYRISGAVMLVAPGGQLLSLQIWKNGALAKQCFQAPQVSTGNLSLPFDAMVNCNAGDYLEVYVNLPQTAVTAGQAGSNEAFVFAQAQYLGT